MLLPVHVDIKQLGGITFENIIYSGCSGELEKIS